MGFQLVQASVLGHSRTLLVFSGVEAYEVTDLSLEPGEDPVTVLRNGLKIVEALKHNLVVRTLIVAPRPTGFRLLHARIPAAATTPGTPPVVTALPSSLVKKVTLAVDRKFHRFSAFKPDRRVTSTGDFVGSRDQSVDEGRGAKAFANIRNDAATVHLLARGSPRYSSASGPQPTSRWSTGCHNRWQRFGPAQRAVGDLWMENSPRCLIRVSARASHVARRLQMTLVSR